MRLRPTGEMLKMRGGALSLLLAITLTLDRGACVLDVATIAHVPPTTIQVLAVWHCGGLVCWERYVEVGGKRVGQTSVCETRQGDQLERAQ